VIQKTSLKKTVHVIRAMNINTFYSKEPLAPYWLPNKTVALLYFLVLIMKSEAIMFAERRRERTWVPVGGKKNSETPHQGLIGKSKSK